MRLSLLSLIIAASILDGFADAAHAVALDPATQKWTNHADGTPTPNSYEIDGSNTGTDRTIVTTGNAGATLAKDITTSPQIQSLAVATLFQGGQLVAGNSLVIGAGAVTIASGNSAITSFQLMSRSGSACAGSALRRVGLSHFSFTRVPEINPGWSALGSCIAAAVLILRHRANIRK